MSEDRKHVPLIRPDWHAGGQHLMSVLSDADNASPADLALLTAFAEEVAEFARAKSKVQRLEPLFEEIASELATMFPGSHRASTGIGNATFFLTPSVVVPPDMPQLLLSVTVVPIRDLSGTGGTLPYGGVHATVAGGDPANITFPVAEWRRAVGHCLAREKVRVAKRIEVERQAIASLEYRGMALLAADAVLWRLTEWQVSSPESVS